MKVEGWPGEIGLGEGELLLGEDEMPSYGQTEPVFNYERLRVYEEARQLRKRFRALAGLLPKEERYVASAQLRRSSLSVVLNIVEGSQRTSGKEQARFMEIAHGSLHESFACVSEAEEDGLLPPGSTASLRRDVHRLGGMLGNLRHYYLRPRR